ncbi:malonate decarboxylase subunit epsilon [Mycobacterium sp. GA-2829]|nr:malonate decarboxylase subunit epsilon [Mycobacterium sp. GA-2829]
MHDPSVAFLFPGQGSQRPGMLGDLPASCATRTVTEEASAVLGGLTGLDTAEALTATRNCQLALLICGVAAARHLAEEHGVVPGVVAGHSVGAFAAAVTAGVLTVAEAVAAVAKRAEAMSAASAGDVWGMAPTTGIGRRRADEVITAAAVPAGTLWVANINAADQIVFAGTRDALERAREAARRCGARRFEMLDIAVASHGPLQENTATRLAAHLAGIPRRRQTAAYLTNAGGRRIIDDPDAVLRDLAVSVARPVQWYDIATVLPEFGVRTAVEMPPGHVLTHLLSGVPVRALSVDDAGYESVGAIG